jgi:type IV secretion system protein VirD4
MFDIILGVGGLLFGLLLFIVVLSSPQLLAELLVNKSADKARERWVKSTQEKNRQTRARLNIEALAEFGSTPDDRAKNIDLLFTRRDGSITCEIDHLWTGVKGSFVKAKLSRPVSAMRPRDREVLRSVYHLHNLGLTTDYGFFHQRLAIVWGDGAASASSWKYEGMGDDAKSLADAIRLIQNGETLEPSIAAAIDSLTKALAAKPDNPILRRLHAQVSGDGGDLDPGPPLKPTTDIDEPGLIIGRDETDPKRLWRYEGEGSLVTIASPGKGKSQCHVIPNLLTWKGGAVVLDIKGELYEATSAWRAANVGPVHRFSPLEAKTERYNPLLQINSDPEFIWEDCRFVADMLVVPSGTGGNAKFFDDSARDFVTAALCYITLAYPKAQRTMAKVLDIAAGLEWDEFVKRLEATVDVPSAARAGAKYGGDKDPKLRENILQTANTALSAWEGARITRATAASDWNPKDLAGQGRPTLYICIDPNQIDSYLSLLRVVIAQHIRALTAGTPVRGAPPVLFFLDELPRLRRMAPVEEGLEVGRQYGVRLWMFAQSIGQLTNAYPNGLGMIGSCAARLYMNPELSDGTAKKLSEDLGMRESLIDGTQQPVARPEVLAGPEWADKVLVMASGANPARLDKHFAHSDPALTARMGRYSPAESAGQ